MVGIPTCGSGNDKKCLMSREKMAFRKPIRVDDFGLEK